MGNSYCACVNNYNKKNCGFISDIKVNEIKSNVDEKKEKFIFGNDEENNILFKNINKKKKIENSTSNTSISSEDVTKLNKFIRGYLIRNKYKKSLKQELEDFSNKIYSDYINKISYNENVSKILYNKENNPEISSILVSNWNEFYENDPILDLKRKINGIKTYKGLKINYQNNKFTSDNLTEILKNIKSLYKGEINFYSQVKTGLGEEIYKDGSQKYGTWYENQFFGWNRYIDSNGNLYIGLFINDKLNGYGYKFTYPNHIYRGEFINNIRDGFGKDIFKGIIYEGYFKNDKKNGQAKVIFPSGDIYEGNFESNKFNGKGHYIWKKSGSEYIGDYCNGLFHGKGIYKWSEKEYYKGDYVNGIKEGYGEIFYPDGRRIEAPFINGKPNGMGKFDDGKGNIREVEFINGTVNKKFNKRKKVH